MPKILLIRLSSIGDIVLTTPVIRCLKQQMPHIELHYLIKDKFRATLAANPYIDQLISLPDQFTAAVALLRSQQYDYIIDLHHNLYTMRLKWALRPIPAFSFPKLNVEKWLLTQFKIDRLPNLHIVDRYLQTLSHWQIENDGKGLDYFIAPADEVDIAQQFPNIGTQAYIALAIGAAHATKQMPTNLLINLCQQIEQPIILLGGNADADKAKEIVAAVGKAQVVSACGGFNLNQSASVLRQAQGVIAPDTGLMHIAAAFGKPIVSVWGNTVPKLGMYPYMPAKGSYIAEVNGLSCRPCSKIGYEQCPKGHFKCMNQQDLGKISQAVHDLG